MPSGSPESFYSLSQKLILKNQVGYDFEKITRVLSSEFAITYGLDIDEDRVKEISHEINHWLNS